MTPDLQPPPPAAPTSAPASPNTPTGPIPAPGGAPRHPGSLWRRGWNTLAAALHRAEAHITENFRVPPHGG